MGCNIQYTKLVYFGWTSTLKAMFLYHSLVKIITNRFFVVVFV